MKMRMALTLHATVALALLLTGTISPFAQNSDEQGLSKFALGGTAKMTVDPTRGPKPLNHVLETTVAVDVYAFASRTLDTTVTDLTNKISVDYYFVSPHTCGGGSPRIQLAIDTDGDGDSDGNAFGYVGPSPSLTNCPTGVWASVSMASAASADARWDLTQFGGPFYNTWQQVLDFFSAYTNHRVLRGSLVDDTYAGSPGGDGTTYFDDVQIGDRILSDPSDVTGN